MRQATKSGLQELQTIISKMPLQACCMFVLPEFGVRWREVSKAVRNTRVPMTPASVARVLCRHADSLPAEEVEDIVVRLRLKLVATQDRKWHVIKLLEPTEQLPVARLLQVLPERIVGAASKARTSHVIRPEVQLITLDELVYLSVQTVSRTRPGSILYVATPPGKPVVLASSITSSLLKAVVCGLGYKSFEDAKLFGRDIPSLLRMADPRYARAEHLHSAPPYMPPPPQVKGNVIDFTTHRYDQEYVDLVLGPDLPLLNDVQITTTGSFFDPSRLRGRLSLKLHLKSEDVGKTLRGWVRRGALAPTSSLLQCFHTLKSNKLDNQLEDDE